MIISVAAYVKDDEVREVVLKSDNIRCRTLKRCYSIPGYADLPRKVRNAVYDNVRLMIERGEKENVLFKAAQGAVKR